MCTHAACMMQACVRVWDETEREEKETHFASHGVKENVGGEVEDEENS